MAREELLLQLTFVLHEENFLKLNEKSSYFRIIELYSEKSFMWMYFVRVE